MGIDPTLGNRQQTCKNTEELLGILKFPGR